MVYFEYQGFRRELSHLSEIHFYKNGGDVQNYPTREFDLIKKYLTNKGMYTSPQKKNNEGIKWV